MRYTVEIDERIDHGSKYPAALNTPRDQIPMTLADLQRLYAEIHATILAINQVTEEEFTS